MYFLKILSEIVASILRAFGTMLRGLLQPVWSGLSRMFKFRPGEFKRPLIVGLASLVIVGSLASIFFSEYRRPAKLNLTPFEGLGEVAGEEAAKLIGDKGRVVVWRWDFGARTSPLQRAQWESFQKSLKKHAEIEVAAVEEDPWQATALLEGGMLSLPNGRLATLLDKYRWADEIVLFGAALQVDEGAIDKLAQHHPRVLVYSLGNVFHKRLLEAGVVQVAIVPRWPLNSDAEKLVTAREWFDRYFMVITSQNAGQLAN